MIHKFISNDNKGNVNTLEIGSDYTKISKVVDPVNSDDAVNKRYVDQAGGSLPSVTSSDNGKVLAVKNGAWAADSMDVVLRAVVDPSTLAITADEDNYSFDEISNFVYAGGRSFVVALDFGLVTKYAFVQPEMQLDNAISFIGQLTIFDATPIERGDIQFRVSESDGDVVFTGGIRQKGKFIVVLTPTYPDYSGTMDKTVAEINAAYEAGKEIVFRVMTSATDYMDVDCTARWFGGSTYPSFNGFVLSDSNAFVFAFTCATNDGTKQTYSTTVYPLTPAS